MKRKIFASKCMYLFDFAKCVYLPGSAARGPDRINFVSLSWSFRSHAGARCDAIHSPNFVESDRYLHKEQIELLVDMN